MQMNGLAITDPVRSFNDLEFYHSGVEYESRPRVINLVAGITYGLSGYRVA